MPDSGPRLLAAEIYAASEYGSLKNEISEIQTLRILTCQNLTSSRRRTPSIEAFYRIPNPFCGILEHSEFRSEF